MTVRETPNRGIRYPGLEELAKVAFLRVMAEDVDTAITKTEALRATALRRPRARAWRATGSASITKNTWTALTGFDTVLYDNNGQANLGVNNDRLTAQTAGLYLYVGTAQGSTGGSAMGEGRISVVRNGAAPGTADHVDRAIWAGLGASTYTHSVWAVFLQAIGDRASLAVWWNGTPAGPATYSSYSLTSMMIAAQ